MRFTILSSSTIALACATLAACSDSMRPASGRPITVSFSTRASTTTGAAFSRSADLSASHSVSTTVGTDVLVINKAQLVIARMELSRTGAACQSNSAAGDDDNQANECEELEVAPSLIDLPVDASVVSALSVSIPAGEYSSLEAKIRPLRAADGDRGKGSSAFLAAHPEFSGVSVRVEGTFNGKPFTYTGAARAELEKSFNPPLVVDTGKVNLTVNADISTWFRSRSGALIDPSTANPDGPNAATVADNIKRSFKAFRDDDRDGHDDDDHGGHI